MKVWSTIVKAISPLHGELTAYSGPNIKAPNKFLAREYCELNGLGYCHINDELIAEIDAETGKRIDYDLSDN